MKNRENTESFNERFYDDLGVLFIDMCHECMSSQVGVENYKNSFAFKLIHKSSLYLSMWQKTAVVCKDKSFRYWLASRHKNRIPTVE